MKALAKTKAVRRKIAEVGPLATAKLVASHLFDRVAHRTLRLYHLELPHYEAPPEAVSESVRIRVVKEFGALGETDRAVLEDYAGEAHLAEVRSRLEDHWTLDLADFDGAPAGGGGVISSETPLWSKAVPILPNDVSINDCFTFPQQRGKNVYPAMLAQIAGHYAEHGYLRAFISVHERNHASIRGIEKAGFVEGPRYEEFHTGSSEIIVWKDYRKRGVDPR